MDMQKKSVMPRHRLLPVLVTLLVLALPGYSLVQSAGAGTTSTVHQVPTSIDRTGATDVSGAISAFIASVPDGSTIVFPASSRYRIEGAVLVAARHNLVINGAARDVLRHHRRQHRQARRTERGAAALAASP